jgi:CRISPR-associated protein Cas6/Cse3/CasE, subtype I-E/ECOLI
MYLSRLLLTGEQLHNPYEIHRTLWLAFPDAAEQSRDFLFRVEQRTSRQVQVLVQSQRQPVANIEYARLLASKALEVEVCWKVASCVLC